MGWPEKDVWKMTPYKLIRLFEIHREMNPRTYGKTRKKKLDAIDEALGGL